MQAQDPRPEDSSRVRRRVLVTLLTPVLSLVLGEIAARVWVATRWEPERIAQLTTHSPIRGRFASHPNLPFALNPDFPGHNALGFRGEPFEARKPEGVRRIACIGASTTYGNLADATDSWPAQLGVLLRDHPGRFEVVNAGVPGWVSTELWIQLELRVLPLDPDVVVILPARNEFLAQAFNGFQPDYTHFRRPGFNFMVSNFAHKEVFRWSHLCMLLCTAGGSGRFGWSETAEHPLYGGIAWENRPTVAEALRNIEDPARMATFRRATEGMVAVCRARGIKVLLCTMQLRSDLLALDELDHDPELHKGLGALIERENEVVREIARQAEVPVAETAGVNSRPDLFLDDSHLSPEGHRMQARVVYDALVPLLGGT